MPSVVLVVPTGARRPQLLGLGLVACGCTSRISRSAGRGVGLPTRGSTTAKGRLGGGGATAW
jgi:hypothetical protein